MNRKSLNLLLSLVLCVITVSLVLAQGAMNKTDILKYIENDQVLKEIVRVTTMHVDNLIDIMNGKSNFPDPEKSFNDEKWFLGTDFFKPSANHATYRLHIPNWKKIEDSVKAATVDLNTNGFGKTKENLLILTNLRKELGKLQSASSELLMQIARIIALSLLALTVLLGLSRDSRIRRYQGFVALVSDRTTSVERAAISNDLKGVEEAKFILGMDLSGFEVAKDPDMDPVKNELDMAVQRLLMVKSAEKFSLVIGLCNSVNDLAKSAMDKYSTLRKEVFTGMQALVGYAINGIALLVSFSDVIS